MADHSQSVFTVLYFAAASAYTGKTSELLPAPLPLHSLFPAIESKYAGITAKVLQSCAVTINLEYVDLDLNIDPTSGSENASNSTGGAMIQAGDEVGIIPPVSSG